MRVTATAGGGGMTERRTPFCDLLEIEHPIELVTAHRDETACIRHRRHQLGRMDRSHASGMAVVPKIDPLGRRHMSEPTRFRTI